MGRHGHWWLKNDQAMARESFRTFSLQTDQVGSRKIQPKDQNDAEFGHRNADRIMVVGKSEGRITVKRLGWSTRQCVLPAH